MPGIKWESQNPAANEAALAVKAYTAGFPTSYPSPYLSQRLNRTEYIVASIKNTTSSSST